jgi:hypothetical protein
MIASVSYKCIGSEPNDGINTTLYFYPASGYDIVDIIVKGKSKNVTIDETTAEVIVDELLVRGDVVTCIYKTLPRTDTSPTQSTIDFEEPDFELADFT